ncbi:homocysteine S-methyltransferase family protein [Roseovarius sp. MMSF_3359]|uniref:homocysteine S-methyltransferase family protein n=2 Tax=unclassified Roseovarius TaxID=2614913 RepID=UPI00273F4F22|nr:homocysteine S-methyltransferase family protein [Roseovarius sp. MMSF_3359]
MAHFTNSNITALMATDRPFLTDGGLETTLVFLEGMDLPAFASFPLLGDEDGRAALKTYFGKFLQLAKDNETGFVLDTPTWRASHGWAADTGHTPQDIDRLNIRAVDFARDIASDWMAQGVPVVINGVVGPAGDGYVPDNAMTITEARDYHARQIACFASAGADMVSAVTINYVEEAIGITRAAMAAELPVVVSFTVETDGKLPTGQSVGDAIAEVDAATDGAPIYYMINCAHPDHFADILEGAAWTSRLGGLRCNASRMSHEELDNSDELDDGDPQEFGQLHAAMLQGLTDIRVLGGCCGTDHRHVGAVGKCCVEGQAHAA